MALIFIVELISRVKALLRRNQSDSQQQIRIDELEFQERTLTGFLKDFTGWTKVAQKPLAELVLGTLL